MLHVDQDKNFYLMSLGILITGSHVNHFLTPSPSLDGITVHLSPNQDSNLDTESTQLLLALLVGLPQFIIPLHGPMIHLRASTDLTRWARGVGTWFNNIKNLINDTRSKSNNKSNLPTPSHQTRRVFARTPFPGTPADLIPMTKRRTWLHYFF